MLLLLLPFRLFLWKAGVQQGSWMADGISSICWLPLGFQGHLNKAEGTGCAAAIGWPATDGESQGEKIFLGRGVVAQLCV